MALDGKDGKEIWRHYIPHEVFAVNCGYDLDADGVEDCLAGGRLAVSVLILLLAGSMQKVHIFVAFRTFILKVLSVNNFCKKINN